MSKRIIINKSQYDNMLKEMAYPVSFNMDEFKSLTSFSARINYCQSRLQRLSSGSSRIVYKIDDDKVLKLAKNKKGIAQNEVEGGDWYKNSIGCFAKIYDVDDNFLWIEMQLARKARIADFKRITGYGWDVVCQWIRKCASYTNRYVTYDKSYDEIFESEEFEEGLENYSLFSYLQEYIGNYTVGGAVGDFMRLNSWGIVTGEDGSEELVIIDSGLNDDVYDNYYGANRKVWR